MKQTSRAQRQHTLIPRRFGFLLRAGFVKFELTENAIPSVVEVENRHIEHQQGIVHSPTPTKYLSAKACESLLGRFHCCLR